MPVLLPYHPLYAAAGHRAMDASLDAGSRRGAATVEAVVVKAAMATLQSGRSARPVYRRKPG
jgi:hypothetical protein